MHANTLYNSNTNYTVLSFKYILICFSTTVCLYKYNMSKYRLITFAFNYIEVYMHALECSIKIQKHRLLRNPGCKYAP